jgi:hypothetical protein
VVGCDGGTEQSVASAVQAVGDEPHVIITCTQVQEGSSGTPQGVAAELQQLQETHDAVAALNKRQLTVYAVEPDASAVVQQRRRLQSSNADVGVCGQLCRVSAQHMAQCSPAACWLWASCVYSQLWGRLQLLCSSRSLAWCHAVGAGAAGRCMTCSNLLLYCKRASL